MFCWPLLNVFESFCGWGSYCFVFPFALSKTHIQHTLSFSHVISVWLENEWFEPTKLRCFKSSMQKYCFWHSDVVFPFGVSFHLLCCCCFLLFFSHFLFFFSVWSFMCVRAYSVCERALRLYFIFFCGSYRSKTILVFRFDTTELKKNALSYSLYTHTHIYI